MDTQSNPLRCCSCKETKDSENFHISSGSSRGYQDSCKDCKSKIAKRYYKKNKERINAIKKVHYEANKDVYQAYARNRQAYKEERKPNWDLELTDFVIKEAYALKRIRTKETGIDFHVDHIVPLKGKRVSGLHVWNNIQVIPAKLNLEKGNRYE